MATVAEDSTSSRTLVAELFAGSVYKGRQGRIVRQLTCLAIWLTFWLGAWQLFEALRAGFFEGLRDASYGNWVIYGVPLSFALGGTWLGYRLVNWPKFADFLISVEAEMSKVSWPTKSELYKASMVVIFTMAFLAVLLFAYDLIWQAIFDYLRVS